MTTSDHAWRYRTFSCCSPLSTCKAHTVSVPHLCSRYRLSWMVVSVCTVRADSTPSPKQWKHGDVLDLQLPCEYLMRRVESSPTLVVLHLWIYRTPWLCRTTERLATKRCSCEVCAPWQWLHGLYAWLFLYTLRSDSAGQGVQIS